MRKFIYLLALVLTVGITLQSCNKDKDVPTQSQTEVSFAVEQTNFPELKADVPMCSDLSMDYAVFVLGGVEYTSPVLFANGKILTQPIKLDIGNYTLTDFLVYHDVLPIGAGTEDILVRAAPEVGSEYWDLMANPLNIEIAVEAFIKKEVLIDVLCFEDLFYEKFGFTWFEMNLVKIERQCFFGDICTGKLPQYEGSLYEQQSQGLQMDMPLIMKIEVWHADTLQRTFDNVANFGEGDCMEVYWANDEDLEEEFTFVLYGWLPVGSSFEWVKYHTWTFFDDNCPETGEDGVVDFVIGECNIEGSDYVFAPYVNLPSETFDIIAYAYSADFNAPATTEYGTYIDLTVSGIPAGPYDIGNGNMGTFCGQEQVNITMSTHYSVKVASSLRPLPQELLDQVTLDENYSPERLAAANWAINNIQLFLGYTPDYEDWSNNDPMLWSEFQLGLWHVLAVDTGVPQPWSDEALSGLHDDYVPLPGEYAINIFYSTASKDVDPIPMQFMIVLVDP